MPLCNLYTITKSQAAIIALARALRDITGNLPPLPGIFPDQFAPIVRNAPDGVRELMMAGWGMPGPPQFGGAPVTNIRNTKSAHWRAWLQPANRCVVPWTSFCEYANTKPRKTPTWFAFDESQPLAMFAGIWTTWRGTRGTKANPVAGEHTLFGFHDRTEQRSWCRASEGHAGHSANVRGNRPLDDRTRSRGTKATATFAARHAAHCGHR
jgi:putative SOS response-associated peptidase YedK